MESFSPIAIVGRACVLPGAHSPQELWQAVLQGQDLISGPAPGRWGLPREMVMGSVEDSTDRTWSDRGGYVTGFEERFSPQGFALPPDQVMALDPIYRWLLHTGRQALQGVKPAAPARVGAVVGNLSFPTEAMSAYAERVWLGEGLADAAGLPRHHPSARFMSGLPAHMLLMGLGLSGPAFALDAACASSLYAIKLACDRLHDGQADMMLAGAVNSADDLFIHVGFCALRAMSRSGQSRPFHAEADGLVPAEGAGLVALKRLEDAQRDGDSIYGVIRGVGLSNDGRGQGLLVPSSEGQVRAMRRAYQMAGLSPSDISLVECHATGTVVGDRTELTSMAQVFQGGQGVPIGSLKSNMGHLVTAAGVAGLIKVLGAMEAGVRPPTLHTERLNPALEGSPFRVLHQAEPWRVDGVRRASVSAFGFGGNNAHLLVEEAPQPHHPPISVPAPSTLRDEPIAVVGLGISAGPLEGAPQVQEALFGPARFVGPAREVSLPMKGLRFPPRDLELALPQQLLSLRVALDAARGLELSGERTASLMGMGADAEIARYGARWRMQAWARRWELTPAQEAQVADSFAPPLEAAGVLGTMPNIPANRVNNWLDLGGPSMTLSGEELSGLRALEVAMRGLQRHDYDAAVVGAVDMSCEPVHQRALAELGLRVQTGDGAAVLVLKRLRDAQRDGDPVLAVLEPGVQAQVLDAGEIAARFGVPHAAWGMMQVACGVLCAAQGRLPGGQTWSGERLSVALEALGGQRAGVTLRRTEGARQALSAQPHPRGEKMLRFPAHAPAPEVPQAQTPQVQVMPQAPHLEPVSLATAEPTQPTAAPAPQVAAPAPVRRAQAALPQAPQASQAPPAGFLAQLRHQQALLGQSHQSHMQSLAQTHHAFLAMRQRTAEQLLALYGRVPQGVQPAPQAVPAIPRATPAPAPALQTARPRAAAPAPQVAAPQVAAPAPQVEPIRKPRPSQPTQPPAPRKPQVTRAEPASIARKVHQGEKPGLKLDKAGLEVHSSGNISEIFGPQFKPQDQYAVQTRMPEPPLLLADRLTGIDAEPLSMKTGTLWTETDIREDAWYMHDGRMPAGLMIESGQADLMLISYLGIDLLVKGERHYRLLGCELTYHGSLPKPGETLCYDIHVDGHARQGDIRLFFFHYDCVVDGQPRLTVRQGQAGFFTREELDDSMGVLWSAEEGEHCQDPRLDPPQVLCQRRRFDRRALEAFAEGRVLDCFGPGFEPTLCHTRTPKIAGGRMLFLEEVVEFDPKGGPWGRGYLRAVDPIAPDDWFFSGHFKNDPCMPGTLMFEGCLQTMAFYMAALGFTIDRDGWRFEPVPEEKYKMICRGEVNPTSSELVYELFVEEVIDGDEPRLYADLLCTVDGLKAFHCRRMGLRMVPDWPMAQRQDWPELSYEDKPVAQYDGFSFNYDSLLACAWGRPTRAFGPMYEMFDSERRVARLPGPPYHFMSRIVDLEGPMGGMKAGTRVDVEYDVPPEAWYFADNGCATMPFCVLLEAALQPCGWLASYVGCASNADRDLAFRNLDGTGTLLAEVLPDAGVLHTRATLTNISSSAGMIIVSFKVECSQVGQPVYTMDTVFGFFPKAALENQVGLGAPPELKEQLTAASEERGVDLTREPARYFAGSARLCEPYLRMIDRVTGVWPEGGAAGLGRYRSEQDVQADAWYFRAHFFQDPVQPGSLGIEAMAQLLQFAMLHKGLAEDMEAPRFEPLMLGAALTWKYRGQVVLKNKKVNVTLDLTEIGEDEQGRFATATASLWVDGMRIYEATNLGMRLVSGHLPRPGEVEVLDPELADWLGDHCPTWTVPALPMMSMVERLASAARREDGVVVALRDLRVKRWLPLPATLSARRDGVGDVVQVELFNEDGAVATGTVVQGRTWVAGSAPLPALDAPLAPNPYESGSLFHGPAFQLLRELRVGEQGASALLDAGAGDVPQGLLHQALLDAATHAIPHDNLHRWCDQIPEDQVAYPAWIPSMTFHGPTPRSGEVRCEVRFDGFAGGPRFPAFKVQLIVGLQVWMEMRLVEALFPKGPIGCAPPLQRRAFLRDRLPQPGVWLSSEEDGVVTLQSEDVEGSDWLPGTVQAVYGTTEPEEIARKEAVARLVGLHPGALPEGLPLNHFPLEVTWDSSTVEVRPGGPEQVELSPVRSFWGEWFGLEDWPVEDLYYGLIERFVRRVVLPDPKALAAVKGRGCLLVANHQTGIESLLLSIIASALLERPVVTLAKAQHRDSWLGRLIELCFSYPGVTDPELIAFFDRSDQKSLPQVLQALGQRMAQEGRSLMIHVEGTRGHQANQPVEKMSGALLELALATGAPVIPVRFVGGLPLEPVEEKLEFPTELGRQDYWLGKPILPEELARLSYADRTRVVVDAINALGPAPGQERPIEGLPGSQAAARAWAASHKVDQVHAVLGSTLAQVEDPCMQTRDLLHNNLEGRSKKVAWLRQLHALLMGGQG